MAVVETLASLCQGVKAVAPLIALLLLSLAVPSSIFLGGLGTLYTRYRKWKLKSQPKPVLEEFRLPLLGLASGIILFSLGIILLVIAAAVHYLLSHPGSLALALGAPAPLC